MADRTRVDASGYSRGRIVSPGGVQGAFSILVQAIGAEQQGWTGMVWFEAPSQIVPVAANGEFRVDHIKPDQDYGIWAFAEDLGLEGSSRTGLELHMPAAK